MSNSINDIVLKTIKSIPVEITNGEAILFNSLPTEDVVSTLKTMIHTETNTTITSRALDALLKVNNFDKVEFLINLYDQYPLKWNFTCCKELSKFQDKRAVKKLCDIALNDPDPSVRYVAIESLSVVGDETVIPMLEHVKAYDIGEDYEGFKITEIAAQAIKKIQKETKDRLP